MRHIWTVMILVILALGLAACGASESSPPPAEDGTTPTIELVIPTSESAEAPAEAILPDSGAAECPAETEETRLLQNPQHGYCLLYPVGHKVERPSDNETVLVVGGLLNTTGPRAAILVTDREGRTATKFADEIVAGFEGFEILRTEAIVAGEPATVLDNVPGQDINRQVIFTHEDTLYHLYFSPFDPQDTARMDSFVAGILRSFTFIPVSETVTATDECVAPKADEQQIVSDEFRYCFVVPSTFTYEQPSATNANLFVGSMMDVQHPKLMFEVTEAGGKSAAEAAEELIASFEGMEISRTFGDTLGYELAERLDGVPGQDLGRVLLVAHNDHLYRLTFVPADPAQSDVYAQMEELFAQVLATFRFLP